MRRSIILAIASVFVLVCLSMYLVPAPTTVVDGPEAPKQSLVFDGRTLGPDEVMYHGPGPNGENLMFVGKSEKLFELFGGEEEFSRIFGKSEVAP